MASRTSVTITLNARKPADIKVAELKLMASRTQEVNKGEKSQSR